MPQTAPKASTTVAGRFSGPAFTGNSPTPKLLLYTRLITSTLLSGAGGDDPADRGAGVDLGLQLA
jgi:hypothetical protein